MTKLTIIPPASLDLHSTLALSVRLAQIEEGPSEIDLDFASTSRVEPFGLLLASSEIAQLMHRLPETRINFVNTSHMAYAAKMGFFFALGASHGVPVAAPDDQAIPITIFDRQTIERNAVSKGVETGDEVEEQSRQMAAMLCRCSTGPVYDTLAYAIREIMRNVVEHSQSGRFGICAQHYPTQKRVEVGILDRGIGIRRSLAANPHLDASDDKRAINYALMPAVSGKAFKGTRIKQYGPWANSGFGLYMTNRICRNGGNFFIASGTAGMLLTRGEGKRYFDCKFEGTAVRLVIRTDQLDNLRISLEQYRKEGFEIQKRYKEIVKIDPSSASLMLSDDFDLSTWDKLLMTLKSL